MRIKASLVVAPSLVGVGLARRPYPTPPFVPPPCTVLSSLYSAVPATVASSFQEEPSQIRGYFYGDSRHNPTWYKDVPEDLKSTLYSMYNTDAQEAFSSSFYFSESSIRGEVISNLPPPPTSVMSAVLSADPISTRYEETPSLVYIDGVAIEYGDDPPPWYTYLPDDVQSWISSVGSSIVHSYEKELSDSITAAASTACWSALQTTDSTDAGPMPTGNDLAIGAAGVAGILGLAFAL